MTLDTTAILLALIRIGFTVSFHILFPAIGLAAGATLVWGAADVGLHGRSLLDLWRKGADTEDGPMVLSQRALLRQGA